MELFNGKLKPENIFVSAKRVQTFIVGEIDYMFSPLVFSDIEDVQVKYLKTAIDNPDIRVLHDSLIAILNPTTMVRAQNPDISSIQLLPWDIGRKSFLKLKQEVLKELQHDLATFELAYFQMDDEEESFVSIPHNL